jgi:hypothetical protein
MEFLAGLNKQGGGVHKDEVKREEELWKMELIQFDNFSNFSLQSRTYNKIGTLKEIQVKVSFQIFPVES